MGTEKYQMLAKTLAGLEEVLKTELEELGASEVEVVEGGVKFSGTKELLYKTNFCCRTAVRIYRFIGNFDVKNAEELYESVFNMEWENFFDLKKSIAISCTVDSDSFNNAMFVSLRTKDAIVDRFKEKFKKRPIVNTDNPDFLIHVHASKDKLSLSLNSSGDSLEKRGYRVGQNEVAISEVIAAGILKMAGWKGQSDFYDTMCGSGTIAVEAALIARNIPPGIFRSEFAFETWKDFDQELFEEVYNDDYEIPFEHKIYASDISPISVKVAEKNAKSAGVVKSLVFREVDFAEFKPEKQEGLFIINPPASDKTNERYIESTYSMIGNQLKLNFKGIKTWIYSSSEIGFKSIGLRPSESIEVLSGSKECSFRMYEVFDGARKPARPSEGGRRNENFASERRNEGFSSGRRSEGFKSGDHKEGFRSDRRSEGSERRGGNFNSESRQGFQKPGFKKERDSDGSGFQSKKRDSDDVYDSGIQVTTFESKSDKKPVNSDNRIMKSKVKSQAVADEKPKRAKRPRIKGGDSK